MPSIFLNKAMVGDGLPSVLKFNLACVLTVKLYSNTATSVGLSWLVITGSPNYVINLKATT